MMVREKSDYIQVNWLTNSTLKIKIGKKTDIININPATALPRFRSVPCILSGKLQKDPEPEDTVTIIGCKDDEENTISVSLPDKVHNLILKDGVTYTLS